MNVRVDNVDFNDFSSALPHGYRLAGTMAGVMNVSGNVDNPLFDGSIALRNGYFVGPIDQNPISKINGTLGFAGNTIALQNVTANVGGGTLAMNGSAHVPDFRRPGDATFSTHIVARNAQINSPKYFRGKINGDVTASRAVGGIATIAGNVDIPSARIPLTAFWNPKAPKSAPSAPLPLAFNLNATVGNDVRVQRLGRGRGRAGSRSRRRDHGCTDASRNVPLDGRHRDVPAPVYHSKRRRALRPGGRHYADYRCNRDDRG